MQPVSINTLGLDDADSNMPELKNEGDILLFMKFILYIYSCERVKLI